MSNASYGLGDSVLAILIEELRGMRRDVCSITKTLPLDTGEDGDRHSTANEINQICIMLRELPREQRPLAFESGGPDGFGPIWRQNAREALYAN